MPQQVWIMEQGNGLGFHASFLGGARLIEHSLQSARIIQCVASAFALSIVVWTYWRRRDPVLSLALFITAIFLFSPYVVCYDMVILGLVVAMLRGRFDNTVYDHMLLIAVWSLPVTMILGAIVVIPLAPIVLTAFAISLIVRLRTDSASSGHVLELPIPVSVS